MCIGDYGSTPKMASQVIRKITGLAKVAEA
jgi:hypothetical protein